MKRVLVVTLGISVATMAASGVLLSFLYRGGGLSLGAETNDGLDAADVLQPLHRVSAYTFLVLVVVTAGVGFSWLAGRSTRRHVTWIGGAMLTVVASVVAIANGPKLAWDALALWSVTVGENIEGIWLPDQTKFVVRGFHEVSVADYHREVWIHLAVCTVLIAVGLTAMAASVRRHDHSAPA